MIRSYPLFAVAIFILILPFGIFGQDFNYDKYKPRTLSELIEQNSPAKVGNETKMAYITADWFYSQVRLKYIGVSRPISPDHKEILRNWQKSFQIPDETLTLFEREFAFKECNTTYWLPVQKQVSAFFPKELKEGQMITLYLFLAGGLRTTGNMDLLFVVNEYDK